jgi:2-polyprenyl-3-methyl-5-hydroxy-6-metoxy-1,4-benzoquinol methylase
MFFRRSEKEFIDVVLVEPSPKTFRCDFAVSGHMIYLMPLGQRISSFAASKFLMIEGQYFSIEEADVDVARAAFVDKYGREHVARHFSSATYAAALKPLEYNPYDAHELQNLFDRISSNYVEEVAKNPVQTYMRQRTSDMLRKYTRPGDSVLDLGSGPMLETLGLPRGVKLTAADISDGMLSEAKKRAEECGRFDVTYVRTDMNLEGDFSQYDVIFTTFGVSELLPPERVAEFVLNHLKGSRIFITSYWNKFGFLDAILCLASGKGSKYLKQKLNGKVLPGTSRFPVEVRPVNRHSIARAMGVDPIERKGICLIIPPYCYRSLIGKFRFGGTLMSIDTSISGLPGAWLLCDYVIAVFHPQSR